MCCRTPPGSVYCRPAQRPSGFGEQLGEDFRAGRSAGLPPSPVRWARRLARTAAAALLVPVIAVTRDALRKRFRVAGSLYRKAQTRIYSKVAAGRLTGQQATLPIRTHNLQRPQTSGMNGHLNCSAGSLSGKRSGLRLRAIPAFRAEACRATPGRFRSRAAGACCRFPEWMKNT